MDYTVGDIKFKDLVDNDFNTLHDYLHEHIIPIAGYSANSLLAWNSVYDYGWTLLPGQTLLIACCRCLDEGCSLLCPIGGFPPADMNFLLDNIMKENRPLKILAVNDYFIKNNPEFVNHFMIEEDRSQSNYVYAASDLAELPGGKYKRKRNHIHQAEGLYSWTAEEMTPVHVQECLEFLSVQDREVDSTYNNTAEIPSGLLNERIVLRYAMEHFSRPGNYGVIIRIDGIISAISVYEIITYRGEPVAQVHFEKALRSRKGMFQVINHETAKIIYNLGIKKINREEDLGDPGLRKAKLSYYPVEMISAWNLTAKM